MEQKQYNLFLDDLRSPQDAYHQEKHEMFFKKEWIVVKDYDEFVSCIHNNGLPQFVSFDHDLHEEHYTPKEFWMDYQKSMDHQDKQIFSRETGLDCAKFLIDYCQEYGKELPEFYSHSANPIGRDRINDILFYYNRYYGKQNFTRSERTIIRKALVHCGHFVDEALLFKGIYSKNDPTFHDFDETIENIIANTEERLKVFSREPLLKEYVENIRQCKLVEVEISFKL